MTVVFRDLRLKRTYSSDTDDILRDFYIPALQVSVEYQRLAGFFSSGALAVAARGLLGLIKNNGKMRLIVCPKLYQEDVEAILEAKGNPESYIAKNMLFELEDLTEGFIKDHVRALGWMIVNNRLDIRVCLPYDEKDRFHDTKSIALGGLFHQKVGILKDKDGNYITFSGSINETPSGWLGNIEEFKVFRSWEPMEQEYQLSDILKFNRFWDGNSPTICTLPIPEAVRQRLIEISPKDIEDITLQRWVSTFVSQKRRTIELFDYQKDAVDKWLKNGMKGIFEMATGTGKTFAAIGCIEKVFQDGSAHAVVIATPYQHLSQQWAGEIKKFGLEHGDVIFADSSHPGWKNTLADLLIDLSLHHRNQMIVLTTHDTFCSKDFDIIIQQNRGTSSLLLVADEVHGLGALQSRKRLSNEFDLRLGLSATPHRWFDDLGTQAILDYFSGVIYEFPLEKAINSRNPATGRTFLTPYRYFPRFLPLSELELEEYIKKTQQIVRRMTKSQIDDKEASILDMLLFARADIVKNAEEKYAVLDRILSELSVKNWIIVYCSPQQIDRTVSILNNLQLIVHRFTMDESTIPEKKYKGMSERDYLLNRFALGEYQVLVAMKCLDEGVDVPAARTAILMCNSSNPREHIQRIGRVLRRFEDKTFASVYDLIVSSNLDYLPPELRTFERKIFQKEMQRCYEIAKISENSAESLILLDQEKYRSL